MSDQPGNSSTPKGRLPSLRPSRDFTLGGKQKTLFTPTVPTTRNKKEAPTTAPGDAGKSERGRGRGGSRGGRGGVRGAARGRGRGAPLLSNTATGFLAMGPSNLAGTRSQRLGGSGGSSGGGVSGMATDSITTQAELDAAMSSGTARVPSDIWAPIAYDMTRPKASSKSAPRPSAIRVVPAIKSDDADVAIKREEEPTALLSPSAQPDLADEMSVDEQLDQLELAQQKEEDAATSSALDQSPIPAPAGLLLYPPIDEPLPDAFPPRSAGDEHLFFFQLPMVLPQFASGPPVVKPEPGTDMDTDTPATASESADGCVGKLRVYESGRMVLQYGSITMEVIGGAECAFPQEIAVIDPSVRQVTMLGAVASRFICTPAVTQLLDEEEDISAAFGDEAV